MTLEQIKAAIEAGKRVYWRNPAYQVIRTEFGRWLIKCIPNGSCTGLTRADGKTMNEKEADFHLEP